MSKNAVNNLLNLPLFCQVTLSRGKWLPSHLGEGREVGNKNVAGIIIENRYHNDLHN